MNNRICIVSGPVHSGKTITVQKCLKSFNRIAGIICPDIDGKRYLKDLKNNISYPFETGSDETDSIKVGKYAFSAETFKKGREILQNLCGDEDRIILVDEIGKLEISDQGLEPALSELIRFHRALQTKLILIIRDYLLGDAIRKYELETAVVYNAGSEKDMNELMRILRL